MASPDARRYCVAPDINVNSYTVCMCLLWFIPQPNPVPPENLTAAGAPQQQTESEGEEPAAGLDLEGAVGGGASAPGAWNEGDTLDWMLSAGIGDPDLFGKLRLASSNFLPLPFPLLTSLRY